MTKNYNLKYLYVESSPIGFINEYNELPKLYYAPDLGFPEFNIHNNFQHKPICLCVISRNTIYENDYYIHNDKLTKATINTDGQTQMFLELQKVLATNKTNLVTWPSTYDKTGDTDDKDSYLPVISEKFIRHFINEFNNKNIIKEINVENYLSIDNIETLKTNKNNEIKIKFDLDTNKIINTNKIKLFAQYLYQPVIFDNKIKGVLMGITNKVLLDLIVLEDMDNNTPIYKDWCSRDTKLILKPLSAITDDHIFKLVNILGFDFSKIERNENYILVTNNLSKTKNKYPIKEYILINLLIYTIEYDDGVGEDGVNYKADLNVYQYLISEGYDMPQYLLDGKTLKDAGLAIYE